jgi:hypothetical protein
MYYALVRIGRANLKTNFEPIDNSQEWVGRDISDDNWKSLFEEKGKKIMVDRSIDRSIERSLDAEKPDIKDLDIE